MDKDTIIKILLVIIAILVFAWAWRIVSSLILGTLFLTTTLLSTLLTLLTRYILPIALIIWVIKKLCK